MRGESLVKEVIEGRMEGKRGRGKQLFMMLDDIKADKTDEEIKRRAMGSEFWRTGCLEPAFKQNTNDDVELYVKLPHYFY